MDCEKFEDALMDELYGELDEVTSAALKRHVASCARCADRLASMKATRRVLGSSFTPVDPPVALEARILEAAAEARKVVPFRSRAVRFVSVAGRWAMRPQTAMAAVFLLMIGSSVALMHGRSASMSPVVVTERGAPAETAASDIALAQKDDPRSAANAHGPEPVPTVAAAPGAAASAAPFGLTATTPAEATKNAEAKQELALNIPPAAPAPPSLGNSRDDLGGFGYGQQPRAARAPSRPAAQAAGRAEPSQYGADQPASASEGQATAAAAPAKVADPSQRGTGTSFADGMAAYRAGRYAEATRIFDPLAQGGDAGAALWAARAVREGSGCGAALARFDKIAGSSWGTSAGYDAQLDAGRCYRQLGSFEQATARFQRLLTVPSHAGQAQGEIDAMRPARAKAAAAAPPPASKPAAPRAAPPQAAPADMDSPPQQRAAPPTQSGF